jgi:Raf kinase inhibitor-like YbhB/YbcL family protein
MQTTKSIVLALIMAPALLAVVAGQQGGAAGPGGAAPQGAGGQRGPAGPAMALTSTGWTDGGQIPVKYTQASPAGGLGVSPPLTWTNAPANTASFVLIFRDPDVAVGGTPEDNLHWMLWNIPGTATGLPEGVAMGAELPDGTRQISVSGPVYRGPGAPATGPVHHYTFELFALDTKLDVQPAATPPETRAAVLKAMSGHIRGKAVYVGLFRRPS